jgi:hypothetical protein
MPLLNEHAEEHYDEVSTVMFNEQGEKWAISESSD